MINRTYWFWNVATFKSDQENVLLFMYYNKQPKIKGDVASFLVYFTPICKASRVYIVHKFSFSVRLHLGLLVDFTLRCSPGFRRVFELFPWLYFCFLKFVWLYLKFLVRWTILPLVCYDIYTNRQTIFKVDLRL